MSAWRTIFIKELKEFSRDRRVLATALLGPFILELLLILGFATVNEALEKPQAHTVLVVNEAAGAPLLEPMRASGLFKLKALPDGADPAEALRRKEGRVVLVFPDDFGEGFANHEAPEFTALFDPNETVSRVALTMVRAVVQKHTELEQRARMVLRGLDPESFTPFVMKEQQAETGKAFAGAWLVSFLPYLIVLWAFYGGFSIVADLVAGEKERGSLETLLVTPVSRSSVAVGKFLALASVSLASCLSALLGVVVLAVVRVPALEPMFGEGLALSPLSAIAIVATLIPLVLFFSGMLLAVSTFGRNMREVNGYLSWLSFVVLVPAIASQFIGYTEFTTSPWLPFIPVLNSATVLREALMNNVDLYRFLVTLAFSAVLACAGVWLSVRLFLSEKVLLRT